MYLRFIAQCLLVLSTSSLIQATTPPEDGVGPWDAILSPCQHSPPSGVDSLSALSAEVELRKRAIKARQSPKTTTSSKGIAATDSSTTTPPSIHQTASSSSVSKSSSVSGCSVRGYDEKNSYNYDGSGANARLAACSARCKADKVCASFGFGGKECLLYKRPAERNVHLNPSSPYVFYDISCLASTSTQSTSSTPTQSTSSTSSIRAARNPNIVSSRSSLTSKSGSTTSSPSSTVDSSTTSLSATPFSTSSPVSSSSSASSLVTASPSSGATVNANSRPGSNVCLPIIFAFIAWCFPR